MLVASLAPSSPTRNGTSRGLAAFGLGGLSALAFAPLFLLPASIVGFAGLVMLVASSGRRSALAVGWIFGFAQFVVGLSWITESFQFAGDGLSALAWPAIAGLSAFLAIFPAIAAFFARCFGPDRRAVILAFPVCWTALEVARGTLFTGFPWNLTAYVWGVSDETMQAASVFGSYGLGLATITLFTAPLLLSLRYPNWKCRAATIGTIIAGTILLWGFGAIRLSQAVETDVPDVRLRLVQGNIPQYQKWNPVAARGILDRYVNLSRQPGSVQPTHVIWPETALPVQFGGEPALVKRLLDAVPSGALLFGAVRQAVDQGAGETALVNSLLALGPDGKVIAGYDKRRLVPFGEYMPFKDVLPLKKMTDGMIDFTPGSGAATLDVPGLPRFRPLICYEAIFPHRASDPGERSILNITNDAWFGTSSGPYQHFLAARFRAVERGLPLVRAANSGISAVVDPYGRVLMSLDLGMTGIIDTGLPAPLPNGSVYGRWRDLWSAIAATITIGLALRSARHTGRN